MNQMWFNYRMTVEDRQFFIFDQEVKPTIDYIYFEVIRFVP